ncbi:uncharacterized protein G6M90_00g054830 [Metarhizium brunneum]|uniref:Uncharacterized protein n=1 Tax=Metarhizium brunneum TaxID=500148 RepID=A0A7D5YUJ8_9HYPO|nr:hypothetical protein G6M90_00g054830 [Metarhizium brunneum]
MRFSVVTMLLASLASGINADYVDTWEDEMPLGQFIGTFDTFSNNQCSEGGKGITVTADDRKGPLQSSVKSVKSYIQNQYYATRSVALPNFGKFSRIKYQMR